MEIVCKNCNRVTHAKYCSNCGQRTDTSRLRRHTFAVNVAYGITTPDRGIWYTLRMPAANPGRRLREYTAGRRVVCFRPFSMLTIPVSALAARRSLRKTASRHSMVEYMFDGAYIGCQWLLMCLPDPVYHRRNSPPCQKNRRQRNLCLPLK